MIFWKMEVDDVETKVCVFFNSRELMLLKQGQVFYFFVKGRFITIHDRCRSHDRAWYITLTASLVAKNLGIKFDAVGFELNPGDFDFVRSGRVLSGVSFSDDASSALVIGVTYAEDMAQSRECISRTATLGAPQTLIEASPARYLGGVLTR